MQDYEHQTATGGFFQTEQKTKPPVTSNTLSPCSVSQVLRATKDEQMGTTIDGHRVFLVKVIGYIEEVDDKEAWIMHKLIDHSSQSPLCVKSLKGDDCSAQQYLSVLKKIKNKSYVSVIGNIRMNEDSIPFITCYSMKLVSDINQLFCHLAHIMVAHKFLRMGNVQSNDIEPFQSSFRNETDNITPLSRQVLKCLEKCTNARGLSINELYNLIPLESHQSILDTMENLASEGHCFTTVDDQHYKITTYDV
ncbi:hypothetical protein A3Q56_06728 [Intoshia linei]|uniref:Replication protein A C-terminal domain-containing protein n=1 Tax=Intoshia linei TaxID=1819745 RepID=A0A177AU58_9BILA|nr:hypothetical protein A3Q56_06728 [Intoshia linei]